MDLLNFLEKEKKIWIIWVSCLEKPRSIKEVLEAWGYSVRAGALYRKKMIEKAVNFKMLKLGSFPGKEIKYLSIFDWFDEKMMRLYRPGIIGQPKMEKKILRRMIKKRDYFKFLEEENVRRFFFDIERIKIFYGGSFENVKTLTGFPLISIPIIFIQLYLIKKEMEKAEREKDEKKMKILKLAEKTIRIFLTLISNIVRNIDITSYIDILLNDKNGEYIYKNFPLEFKKAIETTALRYLLED